MMPRTSIRWNRLLCRKCGNPSWRMPVTPGSHCVDHTIGERLASGKYECLRCGATEVHQISTEEAPEPKQQARIGPLFPATLRNGETVEICEIAFPSVTATNGVVTVWRHLGYRLSAGVKSLESWDTQGRYVQAGTEHPLDVVHPRLFPLE